MARHLGLAGMCAFACESKTPGFRREREGTRTQADRRGRGFTVTGMSNRPPGSPDGRVDRFNAGLVVAIRPGLFDPKKYRKIWCALFVLCVIDKQAVGQARARGGAVTRSGVEGVRRGQACYRDKG